MPSITVVISIYVLNVLKLLDGGIVCIPYMYCPFVLLPLLLGQIRGSLIHDNSLVSPLEQNWGHFHFLANSKSVCYYSNRLTVLTRLCLDSCRI